MQPKREWEQRERNKAAEAAADAVPVAVIPAAGPFHLQACTPRRLRLLLSGRPEIRDMVHLYHHRLRRCSGCDQELLQPGVVGLFGD